MKLKREITTAELATVLGMSHHGILTRLSAVGAVRGLKPRRNLGRGPGRGLRWSVVDVRELLLAPLDRLDDVVRAS